VGNSLNQPLEWTILPGFGLPALLLFYILLGGFLAVSLTDFVQGTIMVLALLIVPIVAVIEIGDPSKH
jgi:Na+/proline symporter